jgi:hypothetical protein
MDTQYAQTVESAAIAAANARSRAFRALRGATSRRRLVDRCELAVAREATSNQDPGVRATKLGVAASVSTTTRPPIADSDRRNQNGRERACDLRAREMTAFAGNRQRANRGLAACWLWTIKQPQPLPISRETTRRWQRWRLTGLLSRSQQEHQYRAPQRALLRWTTSSDEFVLPETTALVGEAARATAAVRFRGPLASGRGDHV